MKKISKSLTPSTEAVLRTLGLKRVADDGICRDFFNPKENLTPRRLVALVYGRYGAFVQEVTDSSHLQRLREAADAIHYYSASPDQADQLARSMNLVRCYGANSSRSPKPNSSLHA